MFFDFLAIEIKEFFQGVSFAAFRFDGSSYYFLVPVVLLSFYPLLLSRPFPFLFQYQMKIPGLKLTSP
jgi:hypothetical protein